MTLFNIYVYFLVFIKTLFILGAAVEVYLKHKGINDKYSTELIEWIDYWKGRCEFIFIVGSAVILIILFTPFRSKLVVIDYESRILLYFLGWILLITAKWSEFFHEAKWVTYLQKIVE
jgi:hypothetical protein